MKEDSISAADLMNYEYCPRIVYFIRVLKQPQTKKTKQIKGLEKESLFKRQTSRSKIIKKYPVFTRKEYNKTFESDSGFITKIDCVAFDDKNNLAFPIQLKYAYKPNKIYRTQKLQLMFEAFLIEESTNKKVYWGYIKYSLSNDLVRINLENRQELFEIIEKVKEVISRERFPDATNYKKRCIDCCYRRMCYG